jgi:hypothetical protein
MIVYMGKKTHSFICKLDVHRNPLLDSVHIRMNQKHTLILLLPVLIISLDLSHGLSFRHYCQVLVTKHGVCVENLI